MRKNKIILTILISLIFTSCKTEISNKVFVNSSSVLIFFKDNSFSYSGIIYGKYKYDKKKREVTIFINDNEQPEKKIIYFYDSENNCLKDNKNNIYKYKLKADEIKTR